MTRPPKSRRVGFIPGVTYFKPAGIPLAYLEKVDISFEELEALRLKDAEGLQQSECAESMNVSRPTFQRILTSAHRKIAEALIKGRAIKISGGTFNITPLRFCCPNGHMWDAPSDDDDETFPVCLICGSVSVLKIRKKSERKSPMKYAVPVEQEKLNPHFGHATDFMLIDVNQSGQVTATEVIASPGHACGYLPGWLASKGVNVILAGGMGMTPRMLFQQNNVEVVLGVQETDPEKAAVSHFNRTLAFGANQCEHGDTACDHQHGG
jgi:uncharacterized protein